MALLSPREDHPIHPPSSEHEAKDQTGDENEVWMCHFTIGEVVLDSTRATLQSLPPVPLQ